MEEIELKLIAGPAFDPADLERCLKSAGSIVETQAFEQHDTYLDTPDAELVGLGLSARVRHKSQGQSVEVKPVPIEAGLVMRRAELRAPVSKKGDPGRTLRKLLAKVLGVALEGGAAPVLELRTKRVVHVVEADGSRVEVCFDTVQVLGADASEAGTFVEVEAEMVSGDEAILSRLSAVLGSLDLGPSGRSKYVRARELLGLPAYSWGATPPSFEASTSFDEVARAVCRHQLQLIRNYEPGTRIGLDTEHLHKMRVATRRLRTALRVFGAAFSRGERRAMNRGFRWLGRRLGAVRDADVALLEFPRWRQRFGPEPTAGWDGLSHRLELRRGRTRRDLIDALDSTKWTELQEAADATFAQGASSEDHIARSMGELISVRLEAFEAGAASFATTHSVDDAHQLRILGKRLRYTVDFLRPALGADVRPLLRRLGEFQDRLGELQDATEAGAFALRELQQETDHSTAFVLGTLRGSARVAAEQARQRVEAAVRELDLDSLSAGLRAAMQSG